MKHLARSYFKEQSIGRAHALNSVRGGQFISPLGCEGFRFRYGCEGGEALRGSDDVSGQERQSGMK